MTSRTSAIDILRQGCSAERAGLLTDIDGTISRIASHPDRAVVEDRARDALQKLARQLTLVGAVSGRSAEDARRIVGLDCLVYSGNHGMEIWRDGRLQKSPLATNHAPRIEKLLESLRITRQVPDLFVENKGLTASIHYREVDDPGQVEPALLSEVEDKAAALDLRVTRGRMVVEIRPPVELSKGTSVIELLEEYQLQSLVYLGDDFTDVDAFNALRDRRNKDRGLWFSIGVDTEATPDAVRRSADALVDGVDGVIELLESVTQ